MSLMQSFRSAGLVGVVALAMSGSAHASVKAGEAAPDFQVASASGKPVKLSDYKGKYVVLEWTNEGCPFVQKHYKSDNMQGLQKDFTGKDVVWLTVFSSRDGSQGHVDAAGAKKFQADYKAASSAMLLDGAGTVGKLYEAKTTPHMYVVDPKGTLIYMGAIDDTPSADSSDIPNSKNFVQLALNESLAGKPVSTPVSKPYGCSIKY
ncbi:MAG: redoxin domain-containing protein [Panacagrimonas sp.]